eukprot:1159681-Pelagomonas_calceolata.AAC.5
MRTHNRTHTHTHAQTHGHLQLLSRNPSTIREADFFSKEASDISAPEREGVAAHSASSALERERDSMPLAPVLWNQIKINFYIMLCSLPKVDQALLQHSLVPHSFMCALHAAQSDAQAAIHKARKDPLNIGRNDFQMEALLKSQTDKLNIPGDDMLASLAQLMCKHACLVAQPPGGLNNCWKKEQQGHHHGQTCVLT